MIIEWIGWGGWVWVGVYCRPLDGPRVASGVPRVASELSGGWHPFAADFWVNWCSGLRPRGAAVAVPVPGSPDGGASVASPGVVRAAPRRLTVCGGRPFDLLVGRRICAAAGPQPPARVRHAGTPAGRLAACLGGSPIVELPKR